MLTDAGVLLAALRDIIAQETPARDLDGGTALVAAVAGFAKCAARHADTAIACSSEPAEASIRLAT